MVPKRNYYIIDEITCFNKKGYKEYALLTGIMYTRIRVCNNKIIETYFADETPDLQILSVEENKFNYYRVDVNDGCKIYRDDGMTYVYVENGLMREQDSRIYTTEKIDQWNLPDIVYTAYELLYKCRELKDYRTRIQYNVKFIDIKSIQKLIKKINSSKKNYSKKVKELLCKNPPKIR